MFSALVLLIALWAVSLRWSIYYETRNPKVPDNNLLLVAVDQGFFCVCWRDEPNHNQPGLGLYEHVYEQSVSGPDGGVVVSHTAPGLSWFYPVVQTYPGAREVALWPLIAALSALATLLHWRSRNENTTVDNECRGK